MLPIEHNIPVYKNWVQDFTDTLVIQFATKSFTAEADRQANTKNWVLQKARIGRHMRKKGPYHDQLFFDKGMIKLDVLQSFSVCDHRQKMPISGMGGFSSGFLHFVQTSLLW